MNSTVAMDDHRLWHRKMFSRVSNCLPVLVAGATFFLIIAGALVTSHDAGLAMQLIIGATLRHSATWDKPLPTDLVLTHLGGAFMVTILLTVAAVTIRRRYPNQIFLTRPAVIALTLLGIQLLLGLAAFVTRQASPGDPQPLNPMVAITVAHVACGALVFATSIILTLRSFRCLRSTSMLKFPGRALGSKKQWHE